VLRYYIRLALKSYARTPGLVALMVGAIALGIAACIVTLTVYHGMSGNPIWWKNDVLYAVTMDSWDPNPRNPFDSAHPNRAPTQLTYRDATYLYQSDIPKRKAIMTMLLGTLSGAPGESAPVPTFTRATSGDFFSMFDVPFEYGGGWSAPADRGPEPVIVLSNSLNRKLFGGADSVGRTILWNGRRFRIVGVLKDWHPLPRFYDMTGGGYGNWSGPEQDYVPFQWAPTLKAIPAGSSSCWGTEPKDYAQYLNSNCVWIEMWVELPTAASRQRFQGFMDAYWAAQRKVGRFQRPLDNHLWNVGEWLRMNGAVNSDTRILLRLAFAFLAVCLINTVGILLAKFLRAAPLTGVRRALGANRRQIFLQHLVEVATISVTGGVLGLALGAEGLMGVQALYAGIRGPYGALAHFDPLGVLWALALAAFSTMAAGLYPAWVVGKLPPAVYLKSR
jgi:putative ABC transport system permease protein